MIKVVCAIRSLEVGGAERQFLELVKKLDRRQFQICVVTMREGALDHEIRTDPAVQFVTLEKHGRYDLLFLRRFGRLIDTIKPDVTYSFMFDMNVYAALATLLARHRTKLIWGIFGSEPNFAEGPRFLRALFLMLRILEWRADLITSDSVRGLKFLTKYGFRLKNTATIFSGTDARRFCRRAESRARFRQLHGLESADIAVGICSRLVPMKGYATLAEAARRLLSEFPTLRFFAVGYGQDRIREECVRILGNYATRFTWLGKHVHPEHCFSGWDIYCSSSIYGEGFSNSIIEAMACELPCVVTDVGDAAIQVGDTGTVVLPGKADALHAALRTMIAGGEHVALGQRARIRVLENFTAEAMVRATAASLTTLVEGDVSVERVR